MAKKKSELDKAVDRSVESIQAQLDTLPIEVAKRKLKELEVIAAKVYRRAKTEKGRPSRRTSAIRLSARSRAKTA